jgi:Ni/Co efflux regulator RcnB
METKMTIKKTKLAAVLAAALSLAAPLAIAANPANAEPMRSEMMMTGAHKPMVVHSDKSRDRDHRTPIRVEFRPQAPRGHSHWHPGAWSRSHGHKVWIPGFYVR